MAQSNEPGQHSNPDFWMSKLLTPRPQPPNNYDVAICIYFICPFPLQIIILFIPFVIAFGIPFFLLLRERFPQVSCVQFRSYLGFSLKPSHFHKLGGVKKCTNGSILKTNTQDNELINKRRLKNYFTQTG